MLASEKRPQHHNWEVAVLSTCCEVACCLAWPCSYSKIVNTNTIHPFTPRNTSKTAQLAPEERNRAYKAPAVGASRGEVVDLIGRRVTLLPAHIRHHQNFSPLCRASEHVRLEPREGMLTSHPRKMSCIAIHMLRNRSRDRRWHSIWNPEALVKKAQMFT